MFGALLDKLKAMVILTEKNVQDIREYISRKYGSSAPRRNAAVFADTIARVIDRNIQHIDGRYRESIKKQLLVAAIRKPVFEVNAGDVFKACIACGEDEEEFFCGVSNWLSLMTGEFVPIDDLSGFVAEVRRISRQHPSYELEKVIDISEAPVPVQTAYRKPHAKYPVIPPYFRRAFTALRDNFPSRPIPGYRSILPLVAMFVFIFLAICRIWFFNDVMAVDQSAGAYTGGPQAVMPPETASLSGTGAERIYKLQDSSGEDFDGSVPAGVKEHRKIKMKATAYDLSVESCGKKRSHPQYGISFSGTRVKAGRTIAVDPDVIPIGSRVYISFPGKYKRLDGFYVAEDTGRLVKGNKVDIFLGEDKPGERYVYNSAKEFGVQDVELYIIDSNNKTVK